MLALAETEVERHGHGALSINHIGKRLGVTGPAVYRHFADRRALLQEIGQRGYARFEAAMSRLIEGGPDVWTKLASVGGGYVRFAVENPGWFRLQFLSHADERPVIDLQRTPPRYRTILLDGLVDSLGDQERATDAYRATWALAHGVASILMTEAPHPSPALLRERADRPVAVFVDGLRALASVAPRK